MSRKIAVFSVVYKGVEPYFDEFLRSLSKQTGEGYVLFLINDGLQNIDNYLEQIKFPVKILEVSGQPSVLRKAGIRWVLSEGADVIVFADSDDFFGAHRIELSAEALHEHDIVCNEIMLVGKDFPNPVAFLGNMFDNAEIIMRKDILEGNCLGLSNTSIRADRVPALMNEIPDDTIAFDWDFFSLCMHDGARAIFTSETETYYRQHASNIASPCSLTDEQILRGVRVKRDHYGFLCNFFNDYTKLAEDFGTLYSLLHSDASLKNDYMTAVRLKPAPNAMWWQPIKTLEELGL